jgi:VWFA-related protein
MVNLIVRRGAAEKTWTGRRSGALWWCIVNSAVQLGRTLPIAVACLTLLAVVSVNLAAQNPDRSASDAPVAEDSGLVLHQNVRRVVVDVIVTDAQGNPVPGLRAENFRLSENGKAQSIRQFEWHGAESTFEPPVPAVHLPMRTFMNLPQVPEKGAPTVLLYDVLNTPVSAQPYAHAQMVDFLKKNEDQQIAIFVLSDRLRLLQGFTSNRELLERAATRKEMGTQRTAYTEGAGSGSFATGAAPGNSNPQAAARGNSNAPGSGETDGTPVASDSAVDVQSALRHMEAEEEAAMLDRRVDITLEAFEEIGRFLAGVPCRKNLIWFSGSFPASVGPDPVDMVNGSTSMRFYSGRMRVASDLLNTAQVAVYPVNARGLQTSSFFDVSGGTSPMERIGAGMVTAKVTTVASIKAVKDNAVQLAAEQATMDDIAQQTGGRAFYNTNGLMQALRTAAADGAAYYTIVYAPTNAKFDGSLRRIGVNLDRGGYHLFYRRSYFADDLAYKATSEFEPEVDGAPAALASAAGFGTPQAHQLLFAAHLDAVGAPVAASPVQMALLMPYQQQAAKAAHRKYVPPGKPVQLQPYTIQYAVLANQLELPASAKGAYLPHLSLAALAFDADGNTLCGIDTTIADAIPPSRIDDVLLNGYKPVQVLFVPVNATIIRLVVRDDRSGRLGSMEVRLPLPKVL